MTAALESRGLPGTIDTSNGAEIHVAQYKSYHTVAPNGCNLQISYDTHDTRLNLAVAVNPLRPGMSSRLMGGAAVTRTMRHRSPRLHQRKNYGVL